MRHYLHLVTLAMIVLTLNGFAQRISNEGVVSPETRIDPEAILPEMNVDPGEVFIVPVQVNNMENLENLRFRVTYDETILTNLAAYATGGVLDNGNYRIQIVYYDPNVIQNISFEFRDVHGEWCKLYVKYDEWSGDNNQLPECNS